MAAVVILPALTKEGSGAFPACTCHPEPKPRFLRIAVRDLLLRLCPKRPVTQSKRGVCVPNAPMGNLSSVAPMPEKSTGMFLLLACIGG